MRAARLCGGSLVVSLVVSLALGAALLGCQTEERVVRYRPMLSSVPGAVSGTAPTGRSVDGRTVDPTAVTEESLVLELPDGSIRLISRTGLHLMTHIINTIDANDSELFVDQVLSEVTKQEFYQRGLDPVEAFVELKRRREDILKLFNMIPQGEYTPGVFIRHVGGGVQRIQIPGQVPQGYRWDFMDIKMEKGQYRLRWFGKR